MYRAKHREWARSVRLLEADMADRVRDAEDMDPEEEDPLYLDKLLILRDQAQSLREHLENMSEYLLNRNRKPPIPPGYRILRREPRIGEEVQPRWLEKTPDGREPGFLTMPQRVAGIYKDKETTKVYLGRGPESAMSYVWNKDEQRFLLEGVKVDLLVKKSD